MKNRMITKILALLVIVIPVSGAVAQWKDPLTSINTADSNKRVDYNVILSTGVVANGIDAAAYTMVAPSMSFRPSERVQVSAGFSYLTDWSSMELGKANDVDLAPRKASTNMGSVYVQASYSPNPNLCISGTAFYIGGTMSPVFSGYYRPMEVSSYGAAADVLFKTKRNTTISLHLSFIKDNKDTPFPCGGYGYNPYYRSTLSPMINPYYPFW